MKQFELDLSELDDAQEAPVRRLVKMVLLIAIRNRATQLGNLHEVAKRLPRSGTAKQLSD